VLWLICSFSYRLSLQQFFFFCSMIYMGMPPKHVTCDICMPFIRASTVNSTMTEWTVLQGTSKNHSPGTLTSGYKLKATKLPARSCDAHADLESLNMLKATRINSRTISITFFLKQRMRSIEYVDKQDRDQKYYVSTTWLIKDNMCTLAHMPMISKAHTFGKDVQAFAAQLGRPNLPGRARSGRPLLF